MATLIPHVAQDLRFALRQLRRSPVFTLTAALILALGLAASISTFAFFDAALLRPLPYVQPKRLLDVTEKVPLFPRGNLSYPDYVDWKGSAHSLQALEAYRFTGFLLANGASPSTVFGGSVSAGFFRLLGVRPLLGRDFVAGEDALNAPDSVLLSYGAWQKWFSGRSSIVGQTVTLSGVPHTVIGVLPATFQFAPLGAAEFWVPLKPAGSCMERRSCHSLYGVGRLRDGATVAEAAAELQTIAQRLEQQYPESNRGQGAAVQPLAEAIIGDVRPILFALAGGAALLLLAVWINISNLLLIRSEGRRHELALRGALGASRARLARQFITEACVLVAFGCLLSLACALSAMRWMLSLIPARDMAQMPYLQHLGITPHVLGFSGLLALLTLAIFSVAPFLRLPSTNVRESLAGAGRTSANRTRHRLRSSLVIMQLALAMVLLVASGLLGKSLWRLLNVPLNFNPENVASLEIQDTQQGSSSPSAQIAMHHAVLQRISAVPGVQSVATTALLPVTYNGDTDWIRFPDRAYDGRHIEINDREISPGYFHTLQVPLVEGRFFNDTDDATRPQVAIVNRAFARLYYPGQDPIGKFFGDIDLSPHSMRQIVGVVDDLKEGSLESEIWPAEYLPFDQHPDNTFNLVIRTGQPPSSLLPTLTKTVHEISRDLGISEEQTMAARIAASPSAWLHRSSAWVVSAYALLTLLLSAVGLYGVVAYSVAQRTREIGVRIALGAQRSSVYHLILGEAGRLIAVGLAAGVACSIAMATLLRSLLFHVGAWDVSTLASGAIALSFLSLVASLLPARRAASIDPSVALRSE